MPFRMEGGGPRFCLITDSSDTVWIFPKGMIDPGETAPQSALKEAWEEAGVRGALRHEPLGSYEYSKAGFRFEVHMFLLEIGEVAARWPEGRWRRRRFCDAEEARRSLGRPEQARFLELALQRLSLR